jgi:CelD/BcsL family acetyltransferase involved in cellulose biosynthesis
MKGERELVKSRNNLEIEVCRNQSDLATKAEAWNALLISSPQRSPMLSYAWVSAYLQHRLQKDQSWYVLFAYLEGRLVGVLPLVINRVSIAGMPRLVLRTPDDSHTFGGDILYAAGHQLETFRALIEAVGRISPDWFSIELRRVVDDSPTVDCLIHPGWHLTVSESAGIGYYFPVIGKYEDYFGGLSKNMRGNLRRAENKLNEKSGLRLTVLEHDAATPEDLCRFTSLESSGWKGREGSAIECSPELLLFYRTLTTRLSESGMLRWEFLERGSELIAGNLSVRFKDIVVIWKLGYDEKYGKYSPGALLFKAVLEQSYKDNAISEFNLMSDTPWQVNWNPCHRAYSNVYIYPIRVYPIMIGFLPRILKGWLRRSSSLMRIARKIRKQI